MILKNLNKLNKILTFGLSKLIIINCNQFNNISFLNLFKFEKYLKYLQIINNTSINHLIELNKINLKHLIFKNLKNFYFKKNGENNEEFKIDQFEIFNNQLKETNVIKNNLNFNCNQLILNGKIIQ